MIQKNEETIAATYASYCTFKLANMVHKKEETIHYYMKLLTSNHRCHLILIVQGHTN